MRKLSPNLDNEDALDTVLEVPIPEEMFAGGGGRGKSRGGSKYSSVAGCTNIKSWMKPGGGDRYDASDSSQISRAAQLQLLLGVIGAPLVPVPLQPLHRPFLSRDVKNDPLEASMAKYIVQQYIAAVGGEEAINSIDSMYAMGKVRMTTMEFAESENGGVGGGGKVGGAAPTSKKGGKNGGGGGEMGGFVLWQKKPDLWCLELVVSGCKLSAGSDGRVAWRQTPWHYSHASRGPPRPLRRSIQGLDPRWTANLFSNSVCIGEKQIDGEDCFVLRLDTDPAILRARSSGSVEIIRHTVWGYFSQRTGLLIHLNDTHLLRIKTTPSSAVDEVSGSVYWETTMESRIDDYRTIDGVNIAHAGRTCVSLYRFGDGSVVDGNARTRMEEVWSVEEVDFNIKGLTMECFLAPSDLSVSSGDGCDVLAKNVRPSAGRTAAQVAVRLGSAKVAAIEELDGLDQSLQGKVRS